MNLIPRFYDATRGEVLVDGKNVRDYTLEELRAKVGVVLQKAVLFKGTIRENLSWGNSDATDEEMYEALETAQARSLWMPRKADFPMRSSRAAETFLADRDSALRLRVRS